MLMNLSSDIELTIFFRYFHYRLIMPHIKALCVTSCFIELPALLLDTKLTRCVLLNRLFLRVELFAFLNIL